MNVESVVNYDNEIAMYPDIMDSISNYMKFYGYEYEVFETWHEFVGKIKEKYSTEIDILGDLGKPDIMILYKKPSEEEKLLIIEVKIGIPVLKDFAQAKMYGDIFKADKVFLVAPYELRRNIGQFYYYNNFLFKYNCGTVRYVRFTDKNLQIQSSIPAGGEII